MSVRNPSTGIDRFAVTRWLAAEAGLILPLRFTRIGGGQSNLTFRVEDATGGFTVLRRPPIGAVLETAHDMAREFEITAGLHRADQKVPRPIALCRDVAVTGAPFYLMEHVTGHVLLDRDAAELLAPEIRRRAGLEMIDTLVDLQHVDLDLAGLEQLRRRTPYIARQVRRWHGQWEASRTRDLPEVDELAVLLAEAAPSTDEHVLVHGDYRLDNLLVVDDGSVAAVLDWELCTTGPPLADLGLALAYWEEASMPAGLFPSPVTSLVGFPTPGELIERYIQRSGRDASGLEYYTALAFWKIAIIIEGVYRRWLTDPTNGAETAGDLGEIVPRLVHRATEVARGAA
ncbi:phosphotransferase family protein [Conexibacter sp. DBS9H8]|uniref:phosphotransferase family protein n=1 Tax=Conexibacter sp. DBS9H8 TaxID=2937801 RepID=UPI002111AE5F|nr:phosphotransferase family protein [Conexibacter sp. DBS9H8]